MYFKETKRVYHLVSLLCVVGEFPLDSLSLLGDERCYKRLIKDMTAKQEYINGSLGEKFSCTALSVSGKGEKTIRLKKAALPLMEWVGGASYWEEQWQQNHWSGRESAIKRNHRVAEVVAMMMKAGVEYRPWKLPMLQTAEKKPTTVEECSFYTAKTFKQKYETSARQISFTRFTGAMVSPDESVFVYNTKDGVMKWGGAGEAKARSNVRMFTSMNTHSNEIRKMILLGKDFETVMATIHQTEIDEAAEMKKNRKKAFAYKNSITSLFRGVHYVPLNEFGVKQLQVLSFPNCRERLLEMIYSDDELSHGQGNFVYDAYRLDRYILCFLDGDVARLESFRQAIEFHRKQKKNFDYAVLCYPEQVEELQNYLGPEINYQTLPVDKVLKNLYESEGDEIYE